MIQFELAAHYPCDDAGCSQGCENREVKSICTCTGKIWIHACYQVGLNKSLGGIWMFV